MLVTKKPQKVLRVLSRSKPFWRSQKTLYKDIIEEERVTLRRVTTSQLGTKQLRLQEKTVEQHFYHDQSDVFKAIAKTVKDTSEKLLEQSKTTTETIEGIYEETTLHAFGQENQLVKSIFDPNSSTAYKSITWGWGKKAKKIVLLKNKRSRSEYWKKRCNIFAP